MAAVVVTVALMGGGTLAFREYRERAGESSLCTLAGTFGPRRGTPEEAFAAWWRGVDPTHLPRRLGPDPSNLPPVPSAADFVRDGRNYRWYASNDVWYQVDIDHPKEAGEITSNDWQVVGANRCER